MLYVILIFGGGALICFILGWICDLIGAATSGGMENWKKEQQKMAEIEKAKQAQEAEQQAALNRRMLARSVAAQTGKRSPIEIDHGMWD